MGLRFLDKREVVVRWACRVDRRRLLLRELLRRIVPDRLEQAVRTASVDLSACTRLLSTKASRCSRAASPGRLAGGNCFGGGKVEAPPNTERRASMDCSELVKRLHDQSMSARSVL